MQTIEQTLFFRSSVASYYHCEKIDYIGYCLDSLHILFGNYEQKTLNKIYEHNHPDSNVASSININYLVPCSNCVHKCFKPY
jgi:hypothetical protein